MDFKVVLLKGIIGPSVKPNEVRKEGPEVIDAKIKMTQSQRGMIGLRKKAWAATKNQC